MLPLFASYSVSAGTSCTYNLDYTPYQQKYDTISTGGPQIFDGFAPLQSGETLCIRGSFMIGSDQSYKLQTTFYTGSIEENKTEWIDNPSIVMGACNTYSGLDRCYTPYTQIQCNDATCDIEIMNIPYTPTHYFLKSELNGVSGYDIQGERDRLAHCHFLI